MDDKDLTKTMEVITNEPAQEQAAPEQPQSEPQAPAPEEKSKDYNFVAMREKQKKVERERDEAMRRLQELEAKQASPAPQPADEDGFNFDPDQLVEGKHLAKVTAEIKRLRNQVKQYEQVSATTTAEIKLKAKYPDFDTVVNEDNLEVLNVTHPEIAQTIRNSQADLYGKAVTAYTMIKKLGIVQENPEVEKEKARIAANQQRPKAVGTVATASSSPLTHAMGFDGPLTQQEKDALFKQMVESRKRL